MVAYTFNLGIEKAEADRTEWVPRQPGPHREPRLKSNKQRKPTFMTWFSYSFLYQACMSCPILFLHHHRWVPDTELGSMTPQWIQKDRYFLWRSKSLATHFSLGINLLKPLRNPSTSMLTDITTGCHCSIKLLYTENSHHLVLSQ